MPSCWVSVKAGTIAATWLWAGAQVWSPFWGGWRRTFSQTVKVLFSSAARDFPKGRERWELHILSEVSLCQAKKMKSLGRPQLSNTKLGQINKTWRVTMTRVVGLYLHRQAAELLGWAQGAAAELAGAEGLGGFPGAEAWARREQHAITHLFVLKLKWKWL